MKDRAICKREGCGKPVAKGRSRFCSAECGSEVNRLRGRDVRRKLRADLKAAGEEVAPLPARACLNCGLDFVPEGRFNRICVKCYRRAEFRGGLNPTRISPH